MSSVFEECYLHWGVLVLLLVLVFRAGDISVKWSKLRFKWSAASSRRRETAGTKQVMSDQDGNVRFSIDQSSPDLEGKEENMGEQDNGNV